MATYPIEAVMSAIRAQMVTTFATGTNPIEESGDESVSLAGRLPAGLIRVLPAHITKSSGALKDIAISFEVECWYLMKKTAGARDVETMRTKLIALAVAFTADETLGGTCSPAQETLVTEIDWTGEGGPFEADAAVQAGKVKIGVVIEESR